MFLFHHVVWKAFIIEQYLWIVGLYQEKLIWHDFDSYFRLALGGVSFFLFDSVSEATEQNKRQFRMSMPNF